MNAEDHRRTCACARCRAEWAALLPNRQARFVRLARDYRGASGRRRERLLAQMQACCLGNDPTPAPEGLPGRTYAAVVRNFVRMAS
jgi:hypothetical protein